METKEFKVTLVEVPGEDFQPPMLYAAVEVESCQECNRCQKDPEEDLFAMMLFIWTGGPAGKQVEVEILCRECGVELRDHQAKARG